MSGSPITRYLEADVRCYLCGDSVGLLRRRPETGPTGMVLRRYTDGAYCLLRTPVAIRCPRCTGSVFAEAFEPRYRYHPERDQADRPRRGRPPTWLVKQREAQRLAEEQRIPQAGA